MNNNGFYVGVGMVAAMFFVLVILTLYMFFLRFITHLQSVSSFLATTTHNMKTLQRAPGERVVGETTQTQLVCFEFFGEDEAEDVNALLERKVPSTWNPSRKIGGSTGR